MPCRESFCATSIEALVGPDCNLKHISLQARRYNTMDRRRFFKSFVGGSALSLLALKELNAGIYENLNAVLVASDA